MSLSVTVQVPLRTAVAIGKGEEVSETELGQLVVDAVSHLQMHTIPEDLCTHPSSFTSASSGTLTPPPSSIIGGDDLDAVTLVDAQGTTRAPSPASSLRTAMVRADTSNPKPEILPAVTYPDRDFRERQLPIIVDSGTKGSWPFSVKNTMTVADLQILIQQRLDVPIERQRLHLQNGRRLHFPETLHAIGMKPGWKITLTHLLGICFPDATMDWWAHVISGSSIPEHRVQVHAQSTTTARDLSLALFAAHKVPIKQQKLFLGSDEICLFDGSDDRSSETTLQSWGIGDGAIVRLQMVAM